MAGDASSSRGGGTHGRVPCTLNSRSGDSRLLDQHHGYVGSTSHGGQADPLADMCGVYRQHGTQERYPPNYNDQSLPNYYGGDNDGDHDDEHPNNNDSDNGGKSPGDMGLYKTNQVFSSRQKLWDWVVKRGRENGCVIVTKRSKKNASGECIKIWLRCDRSGIYKGAPTRRKTVTKKTDCSFELVGKYKINSGGWLLEVENDTHNHEPSEHLEGHSMAMKLSEKEFGLVRQLRKQNMGPRHILSMLKDQNPDNVAGLKTIYNALNKIKRSSKIGETPIQGEPPMQQQQGASPPPQPRVVVRPVPPSADFMREALHLHRESHAMMQWTVQFIQDWATSQGISFHPPPLIVPFDQTNDLDQPPPP